MPPVLGINIRQVNLILTSALLHNERGERIVVVTKYPDDHRLFIFLWTTMPSAGTIIDFVQHHRNFNLGEVRK